MHDRQAHGADSLDGESYGFSGNRRIAQPDFVAASLDFLRAPPGNRLEKLKGDRAGQWSVRINDRWRVCFRWEEADAWDVEIVDYH
jgi:proteic killer suppression protein